MAVVSRTWKFLSTLSLRRATVIQWEGMKSLSISIHALLAESDNVRSNGDNRSRISIHALLAESDARNTSIAGRITAFLSTLSLRRATGYEQYYIRAREISIHALLAESDAMQIVIIVVDALFLSTLSLRRATPSERHANSQQEFLSTLSLRRATTIGFISLHFINYFYPRSPCGERRVKMELDRTASNFYPRSPCGERPGDGCLKIVHRDFYPRSPCGERRARLQACFGVFLFLSTLSLRRATAVTTLGAGSVSDFYPRSPCGERLGNACCLFHCINFYPRSPCGERRALRASRQQPAGISIHALLAESDIRLPTALRTPHHRFLSTLSLRRAWIEISQSSGALLRI